VIQLRAKPAIWALLPALFVGACGGSGDGGGGGGADPINLTNFQPADHILGQSLAGGATPNNGAGIGPPNQSGLLTPSGHVGNGSVYVADTGNNRVLGWNGVPTGLGPNADFVIGQTDFISNGAAVSATQLSNPTSCWVASGALFVADQGNDRVLIYGGPPTSNVGATVALGKPNLTTAGGTSGQAGLSGCFDVCVAANRIVVADTNNNRVMIWNGIPGVSGANAQTVIGQPNFTTVSPGATAAKMDTPSGVWTDGIRLAVVDQGNHRVLIWTTFPTSNGEAADLVVGQPDFTTNTSGSGAQKFSIPWSVASDGVQLFVADNGNNRVLVFAAFPVASNPAATGVLGQSTFTNVASNDDNQDGADDGVPTARTMNGPQGVTAVGNRLYVSDTSNHRILIFTGS
jgi:hypothetical protein